MDATPERVEPPAATEPAPTTDTVQPARGALRGAEFGARARAALVDGIYGLGLVCGVLLGGYAVASSAPVGDAATWWRAAAAASALVASAALVAFANTPGRHLRGVSVRRRGDLARRPGLLAASLRAVLREGPLLACWAVGFDARVAVLLTAACALPAFSTPAGSALWDLVARTVVVDASEAT